jgi:hypothetical protein
VSNEINEILFIRAAECIDYFQDKLPAQVIEQDLERNDLEALVKSVATAEAVMAQEEMTAEDIF